MKIMIHRDALWHISPWTMYCILIWLNASTVDFLYYYHCYPQHRMALCHLAPSPWRNMGLKVGQLCGTSNLYQLLKLKSLESCYWMLGINAGSSDWSTWKHQHGGFSVAVYNSYGSFYILMYKKTILKRMRTVLFNKLLWIPSSGLHISDISGRCIMAIPEWSGEAIRAILKVRHGAMPGAFKRAKKYLLGEPGNPRTWLRWKGLMRFVDTITILCIWRNTYAIELW